MSYNDPTDIEAVLEVPPTPPAATPAGVSGPAAQSALQVQPAPLAGSPSGEPLPAPSGPPLPIQTPPSARAASKQLVPVPAPLPVIAPTTQTPLSVDGVDATPQTPQTTQPGVLNQS